MYGGFGLTILTKKLFLNTVLNLDNYAEVLLLNSILQIEFLTKDEYLKSKYYDVIKIRAFCNIFHSAHMGKYKG